jgi:hypothetical protein
VPSHPFHSLIVKWVGEHSCALRTERDYPLYRRCYDSDSGATSGSISAAITQFRPLFLAR